MRALVLIATLALLGLHGPSLLGWAQQSLRPAEDPSIRAALALRCGDLPAPARNACARELRHDFAAGTHAPELIVRRHCIEIQNDWAPIREKPEACRSLHQS